jgi:hypothetical protein
MRIAVNTRFLLPGKLEGLGWYTHELMRRMVLRHPNDEFVFLFDRPFDPAFVYADNMRPVVLFPPARHPLLWYAWFEWGRAEGAGPLRRRRVFFARQFSQPARQNAHPADRARPHSVATPGAGTLVVARLLPLLFPALHPPG